MKKTFRFSLLLTMIIFCSALFLGVFSFIDKKPQEDSVKAFLEFEQKIMEMTKNDSVDNSLKSFSLSENEEENKFVLKRLIVVGNVKNTYNAINTASFNNLTVLEYDSIEETEIAYNFLKEEKNINVLVDKYEKTTGYAETDYSYDSNKNWGAEAMYIGGYRQFLTDNNVNKEVVVVVMDTGINTSHPMFENRLLTDENGKIRGFSYVDSNYKYSYNNLAFDQDDPNTTGVNEADTNKYGFEDDEGHGTHVAGIITSLTPENVKILPIKIGNREGLASVSDMLAAHLRIINIYSKQYNIVCTNLSFSGAGKSNQKECDTYNTQCYEPMLNLNILPITSAGNESERVDVENLKAVVVSSLMQSGSECEFDRSYSNYGSAIDISAPGTLIDSGAIASFDSACSNYVQDSGTSMASPQVAGIVALLYLNPNLEAGFTALEIEQMLYDNVQDLYSLGKDEYYGYGMANLKYFQVPLTQTLTFYENDAQVVNYEEIRNFSEEQRLTVTCSDSEFKILYTNNKTIPTYVNNLEYSEELVITDTTYLYFIGVKIVNNEIVERTPMYNLSYFYENTPVEECLIINEFGTIVEYKGNYEHLTIPNEINGIRVKKINVHVFEHSNLVSVTLPNSIESISGYVFQNSEKLKYVYAPNVKKIYIAAFMGCTSLKFVTSEHPDKEDSSGCFLPCVTEFVGFTFNKCSSLESVELTTLTTLGDKGYDFQSCKNLKSAYLPNLTSISDGMFNQCLSLTGDFYIGKNVSSVGYRAFAGNKLNSFNIDENNKNFYTDGRGLYYYNSIVSYANGVVPQDYTILSNVNINGSNYTITTIEQEAFFTAIINSITIPFSIQTIKKFAFAISNINVLNYNAANATFNGYYDNGYYLVFGNINTINIGANVNSVPQYLFNNIDFKNVILNSKSTQLLEKSLNREGCGDLDSLYLNFTESLDSTYFVMLTQTSGLLRYTSVDKIYSKAAINVSLDDRLSSFVYSIYDNEYYIYSKTPIGNLFTITATSNEFGVISPNGEKQVYEGENATYFFYPNEGYYLASVVVDGEEIGEMELKNAVNDGFTFENVTKNHTITANFAKNPEKKYKISLEINENLQSAFMALTDNATSGYTEETEFSEGTTLYYYAVLKEDTAQYIYFISGTLISERIYLIGSITVSEDRVISVNGNKEVKEYLISFVNYDGSVLQSDYVKYGETPVYSEETPSKPDYYKYSYVFKGWSPSIEPVKQAQTYEALFDEVENFYTVTIEVLNPQYGSVDILKIENVPHGSNVIAVGNFLTINGVTITATKKENTVAENYYFNGFMYDSLMVLNDMIIFAMFSSDAVTYQITWQNYDGEVLKIDRFRYGEDPVYNGIVPSKRSGVKYSYKFSGWSPDISKVTEDKTYVAMFDAVLNEYKIILKTGEGGNAYEKDGKTKVEHGGSFQVQIEPKEGWKIKEVQGLYDSFGAINNTVLFENVSQDIFVEIIFEKIKLKVSVTCDENGSVNPSGEFEVLYGSNKHLIVTPNQGYVVKEILVNDKKIENTKNIFLEDIKTDIEVLITFSKELNITTIAGENGSVSSSSTIIYGDSVRVDFYPDVGYKVKDVKVNNVSVGAVDYYIFSVVEEDLNISVEFEKQTFKISIFIDGEGSVSSEKDLNIVEYGEDRTLVISPKDGWKIYKVFVNGKNQVISGNIYYIINAKEDVSFQVVFEEEKHVPILSKVDANTILIAVVGALVLAGILVFMVKLGKLSKIRKQQLEEIERFNQSLEDLQDNDEES